MLDVLSLMLVFVIVCALGVLAIVVVIEFVRYVVRKVNQAISYVADFFLSWPFEQ